MTNCLRPAPGTALDACGPRDLQPSKHALGLLRFAEALQVSHHLRHFTSHSAPFWHSTAEPAGSAYGSAGNGWLGCAPAPCDGRRACPNRRQELRGLQLHHPRVSLQGLPAPNLHPHIFAGMACAHGPCHPVRHTLLFQHSRRTLEFCVVVWSRDSERRHMRWHMLLCVICGSLSHQLMHVEVVFLFIFYYDRSVSSSV